METTATTAPTIVETVPAPSETISETADTSSTIPPAETTPAYTELVPAATEISSSTEITEVIGDAVESIDYSSYLVQIENNTSLAAEASSLTAGFCLTFTVALLCYFCYRFLRIFF